MRVRSLVLASLAVIFGLVAVTLSKVYLDNQTRRIASAAESAPSATIVVAAAPLRFGQELTSDVLREIAWPAKETPAGAYATIEELLKDGERAALGPIEVAEPVLRGKITGPGQKATLSATLTDGMKALSIRVNDVNGVAGFVLPGDRVDVMLTRNVSNPSGATDTFVDVLLQNVKVIAIDQLADENAAEPSVVKTVTLEVDTDMGQRLTLAQAVGTLSLALRPVASSTLEQTRRISLADLTGEDSAALAAAQARDQDRYDELTSMVEEVGSSLTQRIETMKKQLEEKDRPVPVAASATPALPVPVIEPDPYRVINVYRNTERTEYQVKN